MIDVRVGSLEAVAAGAAVRPVASDFSPVTPAMARFDRAAGPAVAAQCERLGDLPLGSAVITAGGSLAVPFIVHVAVRSTEDNATSSVVRLGLVNGLRRLEEWAIEDAAIAPMGTGAGNLDPEEAAEVMVPVLADHLRGSAYPTRVVLVVDDDYQRAAFVAALARHAGELAGTEP
jgi:O-acetyl-ADP-ribose deacetylase (regulator of RNase III)